MEPDISAERLIREMVRMLLVAPKISDRRKALRLLGKLKPELGATLILECRGVAKDKTLKEWPEKLTSG